MAPPAARARSVARGKRQGAPEGSDVPQVGGSSPPAATKFQCEAESFPEGRSGSRRRHSQMSVFRRADAGTSTRTATSTDARGAAGKAWEATARRLAGGYGRARPRGAAELSGDPGPRVEVEPDTFRVPHFAGRENDPPPGPTRVAVGSRPDAPRDTAPSLHTSAKHCRRLLQTASHLAKTAGLGH